MKLTYPFVGILDGLQDGAGAAVDSRDGEPVAADLGTVLVDALTQRACRPNCS